MLLLLRRWYLNESGCECWLENINSKRKKYRWDIRIKFIDKVQILTISCYRMNEWVYVFVSSFLCSIAQTCIRSLSRWRMKSIELSIHGSVGGFLKLCRRSTINGRLYIGVLIVCGGIVEDILFFPIEI